MAYTIQTIHDDILFLIDKEQNGHTSHEEIDQALHISQMEALATYVKGLGTSTYINDAISPFIYKETYNTGATTGGAVTLPSGFMKTVSLFALVYNNDTLVTDRIFIEPVTEEQLPDRLLSQVLPISVRQPVYVQRQAALQVYPASAFNGELIYVKEPAKPVFAYSQVGRVITYDSGSSTNLQWRPTELNGIIYRAIEILGFNLNDLPTIQFGDKKKNEN